MIKRPIVLRRSWCWLDLFCLIVASLGICGMLEENRQFIYDRQIFKLENLIEQRKWRLTWELDENLYNHQFNPGIYTAAEIELIERDYLSMFLWVKHTKELVLKAVETRDTIKIAEYPVFCVPKDVGELTSKIDTVKKIATNYNQIVCEYRSYVDGKEKMWYERLYNLLYPLFVTIGLAYQIVKWLKEYLNKRTY